MANRFRSMSLPLVLTLFLIWFLIIPVSIILTHYTSGQQQQVQEKQQQVQEKQQQAIQHAYQQGLTTGYKEGEQDGYHQGYTHGLSVQLEEYFHRIDAPPWVAIPGNG